MAVLLEIIEKLLSDLVTCHYGKNCSTEKWEGSGGDGQQLDAFGTVPGSARSRMFVERIGLTYPAPFGAACGRRSGNY